MPAITKSIEPFLNDVNEVVKNGVINIIYDIQFSALEKKLEKCKSDMEKCTNELNALRNEYNNIRKQPENIHLQIEEKPECIVQDDESSDEEDDQVEQTEEKEEEEDQAKQTEEEEEEEEEEDQAKQTEEDQAKEEDSDDEEVFEIEIDDVTYYATNEENGPIYAMDESGDPGNKIGHLKDGEPFFY